MTQQELIEILESINSVTSRNGLEYSIKVEGPEVVFKRPGKSKEEYQPIEELLELINAVKDNPENLTTTFAKEYISGRKQSPAVAIADAVLEIKNK